LKVHQREAVARCTEGIFSEVSAPQRVTHLFISTPVECLNIAESLWLQKGKKNIHQLIRVLRRSPLLEAAAAQELTPDGHHLCSPALPLFQAQTTFKIQPFATPANP